MLSEGVMTVENGLMEIYEVKTKSFGIFTLGQICSLSHKGNIVKSITILGGKRLEVKFKNGFNENYTYLI